MSKSKSKTFPKGTNRDKAIEWVEDMIDTVLFDGRDFAYDKTTAKYLITITKYEEKEFSDKGREKE